MPAPPGRQTAAYLPRVKPQTYQIDPSRLRYPQLWTGLSVLLPLWENAGNPQEFLTGARAVATGTPGWARDGANVVAQSTVATSIWDIGSSGPPWNNPTNAITVWCRHKWNGVSNATGSLIQQGGGAGDSSWYVGTSGAANTFLAQASLRGTTAPVTTATATAAPTTRFLNYVLRWQSPGTLTLTVYEDGGAIFIGPQASAAITGPIAYVAAKPMHLFNGAATSSGVMGQISGAAVWNRRLTDTEVLQLVGEPFALLQPGPQPELLGAGQGATAWAPSLADLALPVGAGDALAQAADYQRVEPDDAVAGTSDAVARALQAVQAQTDDTGLTDQASQQVTGGGGAITLVGVISGLSNSAVTGYTPDVWPTVQAGDLIVIYATTGTSGPANITATAPGGAAYDVGADIASGTVARTVRLSRVAASNGEAAPTINHSTAGNGTCAGVVLRGQHSTYLDVTETTATTGATATTVALPNLTTATAGDWLLVGYAARAPAAPYAGLAGPAGFTEQVERKNTATGSGSSTAVYTRDANPVAVGTYGGETFTEDVAGGLRQNIIHTAIRVAPGGGGTAYTPSVADAAGLADQAAQAADTQRAQADSAGTGDTMGQGLTVTQAVADSANITDAIVQAVFTDHQRAQADDAGLSDLAAQVAAMARTYADLAGLGDTPAQLYTAAANLQDAAVLTDSVLYDLSVIHSRTINDTGAAVDTIAQVLAAAQTLQEAAGVTDQAAQVTVATRTLTDDAGTTDQAAYQLQILVARSLADLMAGTDLVGQQYAGNLTMADVTGLADTANVSAGILRALADAGGLTDQLSYIISLAAALTDTEGLTDSMARLATIGQAIADALTSTDALGGIVAYTRTQADAFVLADTILLAIESATIPQWSAKVTVARAGPAGVRAGGRYAVLATKPTGVSSTRPERAEG